MPDGLLIEVAGGTVNVRIDAGPGNLFTPEMTSALTALLETPPAGAHVIRLSASGPDFCLGRAPFRPGIQALSEDVDGLGALTAALRHSPAVTVAEVQGDAAGFGVAVVAFSDVAVASPDARFSFPEVDAGFAPALVLSWLPDLVGRRMAFWLSASAVELTAREAAALGLVTVVAEEPENLDEATTRCVELLRSKAPAVHTEIKRLLGLFEATGAPARGTMGRNQLILGALRRAAATPQ